MAIAKDISFADGYIIISDGRVYSKKSCRFLKQRISNCGYARVALYINKIFTEYSVHRLVASHFIDKIEGKDFVNHKDFNKINNNVENLEWVTREENAIHYFSSDRYIISNSNKNGKLSGELNGNAKLTKDQVISLRNEAKTRKRGSRLWEKYNISQSMFYYILNGTFWSDTA